MEWLKMIWPFSARFCTEFLTFICSRSMKHYDNSRLSLFGYFEKKKKNTICVFTGGPLTGWCEVLPDCPPSQSQFQLSPMCCWPPAKIVLAEAKGHQLGLVATILNWTLLISGGGAVYFFALKKSKEADRWSFSAVWTLFKSQCVKQTHWNKLSKLIAEDRSYMFLLLKNTRFTCK